MRSKPQEIGRYKVQGMLGQGAMGTVYLAQDPLLMRLVAIKVLRDPGGDSSRIMERFHRESVISAKLNHPNVITIFDVGEDPELGPFMAMEYVDGVTLTNLIREKLPPETGLRLLAQTMSALVASEAVGITHRDVKPDNILVGKDWRVKLLDFGIARGEETRVTQAGVIFGTPFYTAPEVLLGEEASWVADRYAFAVTAFEVLSGDLPFQGSNVGVVVYRIVHEPPKVPDSFTLSMRMIFERALAKDPSHRYPDLFSFMEALIEAANISDVARSRLQHYVLEVRSNAAAPPMEFTQSLEDSGNSAQIISLLLPTDPSIPSEIEEGEEAPHDVQAFQTMVVSAAEMESMKAELEALESQLSDTPDSGEVNSLQSFLKAMEAEEPPKEPEKGKTHPLPIPPQYLYPLPESAPSPADTRPVRPPADLLTPRAPASPRVETQPVELPVRKAREKHPILPSQELSSPLEEMLPVLDLSSTPSRHPAEAAPQGPFTPPATATYSIASESSFSKSTRFAIKRKGFWIGILLIPAALIAVGGYLLLKRDDIKTPVPVQNRVSIASFPIGATVYLDGQKAGKTPLNDLPVEATGHEVRVELTGYRPEIRQVRAGERTLQVALKAIGFPLSVSSDPSGAEVYLNDTMMGTTPMPSLMVPSRGRQELILRLPGYQDWQATVDPDLPLPDPIRMNPAATRRKKSR